jgi:hypothetical protein
MKGEHLMNIAVILTDNQITVADGKRHFSVASGTSLFEKMKGLYKSGNTEGLLDLADVSSRIKTLSKGAFNVVGDKVYVGDNEVHNSIGKRLIAFAEDGLPFTPLVEFCHKLHNNMSESVREQLYNFLAHNNIPITEDGCFIAYKGVEVNEHGLLVDAHTKTFVNEPGRTVEMPREQVDDDPNVTCSHGLHVAAHDYAENFASVLISVKVDPENVVSVPVDYDGQKMRVCKYEVLEVISDRQPIQESLFTEDGDIWDDDDDDIYNEEEEDSSDFNYTVSRRHDGDLELPASFVRSAIQEGYTHFKVIKNGYDGYSHPHLLVQFTMDDEDRTLRYGARINKKQLDSVTIDVPSFSVSGTSHSDMKIDVHDVGSCLVVRSIFFPSSV